MTKTFTENSVKNNQAVSDLNEKVLELMNDKCMIAPYLASSLVILFKPENRSQFNLIKDQNSIRMNDFLMKKRIPVTQYSNILTFRDSNKPFKLNRDLLERKTNYDIIVDLSNQRD